MAFFQYIGDQRAKEPNNPREITLFGARFKLDGDPVEVSDADAVRRLRGNSHFQEMEKIANDRPQKSDGESDDADDEMKELRAAYREAFGKNPGPKWDADTIRAKLIETE